MISSAIVDALPKFNGASGLRTDEALSIPQFTIEMRFQVSNTGNRNRDVFFSNPNGKEFMARFEDPQRDENGSKHIRWFSSRVSVTTLTLPSLLNLTSGSTTLLPLMEHMFLSM